MSHCLYVGQSSYLCYFFFFFICLSLRPFSLLVLCYLCLMHTSLFVFTFFALVFSFLHFIFRVFKYPIFLLFIDFTYSLILQSHSLSSLYICYIHTQRSIRSLQCRSFKRLFPEFIRSWFVFAQKGYKKIFINVF